MECFLYLLVGALSPPEPKLLGQENLRPQEQEATIFLLELAQELLTAFPTPILGPMDSSYEKDGCKAF